MPTNLPRLIPASDSTDRVEVQATTLHGYRQFHTSDLGGHGSHQLRRFRT
jgi:hypothetical protein